MSKKLLVENVKMYIQKNPEMKRILDQLNIDEETYAEALRHVTVEEGIDIQPLTESTYLKT